MGANCCVAARDKPSPARNNCDVTIYRNVRSSPTWSLRWDNRTHIEDIMENPSRISSQHSGNFSSEIKSLADTENERISEGGSPSFSIRTPQWRKKLGTARSSKSFCADQSPRSNFSSEEKYSFKSPSRAIASHTKLSMLIPSPSSSSSSFKTSDPSLINPSSSSFKTSDPSLINPTRNIQCDPSSSRKARWFPKHEKSNQTPDNNDIPIEEYHDSWSMQTFTELVAASAITETHPFDTENPIFNINSSPQSCKICSKLMKEKSPWSAQKIVSTNELAVAAVLVCGHVYHADCLENITSDIDRYDPQCPICTNSDKYCFKMKSKSKISRRAIVDVGAELNTRIKKPFLKRHFSIGSVSVSEDEANRKRNGKGFWRRYNSKI